MSKADVDNHAQAMIEDLEGGPVVLNRYLFIAQGFDDQGRQAMYMAGTDGNAVWDELGMLEYGKNLVLIKMAGLEENDG